MCKALVDRLVPQARHVKGVPLRASGEKCMACESARARSDSMPQLIWEGPPGRLAFVGRRVRVHEPPALKARQALQGRPDLTQSSALSISL